MSPNFRYSVCVCVCVRTRSQQNMKMLKRTQAKRYITHMLNTLHTAKNSTIVFSYNTCDHIDNGHADWSYVRVRIKDILIFLEQYRVQLMLFLLRCLLSFVPYAIRKIHECHQKSKVHMNERRLRQRKTTTTINGNANDQRPR